jgi:hypothetical protein
MKMLSRFFLPAIVALAAFYAHAAQAASLGAPEAAGMQHAAEYLYVDPAMPSDQVTRAQELVEKARKRVELLYGELVARPKIIFCATTDCYRKFGAVGLGFTDGTNLVISAQGRRVAIIAHELSHIEFSARVGGFAKVLERVPQWFDEGQAVMVSMAEEFSEDAWKTSTENGKNAPQLNAIASMDDWIRLTGPTGENMQLTYGTAKREVSRWFKLSGKRGFQALLRALHNDEPFSEAYSRIEATYALARLADTSERQSAIDVAAESGTVLAASFR